jgi:AraC-like DNA-binding protein
LAFVDRPSIDSTRFVRVDRFTTLTQDPSDQFDCWQRMISPIAHVERSDFSRAGFSANVRGYDLGNMHFLSASIDPMKYSHTLDHVQTSGIDHWLVSLLVEGFEVTRFGNDVLRLPARSLSAISMAHPVDGHSGATKSIRVFLSRDMYSHMSDALDAATLRRIEGPLSFVLIEYMLAMESFATQIRLGDLAFVTESFINLLLATLNPLTDNIKSADRAITASRFNIARKYIQKNLAFPTLSSRSICQALGISRRHLYYLFERHGGVANRRSSTDKLNCIQLRLYRFSAFQSAVSGGVWIQSIRST